MDPDMVPRLNMGKKITIWSNMVVHLLPFIGVYSWYLLVTVVRFFVFRDNNRTVDLIVFRREDSIKI